MTNNLEKAKELKFRKKELLEGVKYLNSYELKTLSEIKKEAKDLKEKIENDGCRKEKVNDGMINTWCGGIATTPPYLCSTCEKAIKICEEILK